MTNRRAVTLLFLLLTTTLSAATFTVTSSNDTGPGTLHQAILDANATPGLDQIRFALTEITLGVVLPAFTDPVDIAGPVLIDVVLFNDPPVGFRFSSGSGGSTLRDITFLSFGNVTIEVNDVLVDGFSCVGCLVSVQGSNNTVLDSTVRGVVRLTGPDNDVEGSTITQVHILFGDDNTLTANTISRLDIESADGTIVESNLFPGSAANDAILVRSQVPVLDTTIAGNTISGYTTGVNVSGFGTPPIGVRITGNSISNTGLAIDLGSNGPTPNDAAPDADLGANNLQNFPILTTATLAGGSLVVTGTLTSAPLTTYLIEIFSDTAASADARTLLASFNVTTDAAGLAAFSRTVTSPLPAADEVVTATATHELTNDTSEVSAPIAVDAPGTLQFDPATYTVNESDGTVLITVTRSGGSEGTVTVQYTTQPGSAIAPADYTTTNGTLTFGPGVTSQTFSIPIVSDGAPEPEESFSATLSGTTGGATIGTATATIVIASHLPEEEIPTASTWGLLAMAAMLGGAALLALRRMA